MKTITHFFKLNTTFQLKPLCTRLSDLLLTIGALLWSPLHLSQRQAVLDYFQRIQSRVTLEVKIGRIAVQSHCANKRHLVGDSFLILGGLAIFFHQVFNESAPDHIQHYGNNFHLFYTLRPFIMLVLWSVTSYCYSTNKSGLIIFTTLQSAGWLGIIHYSFFVHDYYSYHSWPLWSMWFLAVGLGVGFMMAVDHLVYVWEHKIKGNHKRFVMLAEHRDKIDAETRERMLTDNLNEYRNLYKNY